MSGVRVNDRVETFLARSPELRRSDLERPEGISDLLRTLAGARSVTELAHLVGKSRFVVSRWLAGRTEIKLPDLLRFVECTTFRLVDFAALFVDAAQLPSLRSDWERLDAARRAAYDEPWSHAVLRVLECADVAPEGTAIDVWICRRLGIPRERVRAALRLLEKSGQVKRSGGRLRPVHQDLVDTSTDVGRRRALRTFWARVAVQRLATGAEGIHAFNLFAIAERDIPRFRELHREFFERLRALANESEPSERVMLYSGQLLALDASSR